MRISLFNNNDNERTRVFTWFISTQITRNTLITLNSSEKNIMFPPIVFGINIFQNICNSTPPYTDIVIIANNDILSDPRVSEASNLLNNIRM
jgi:hypothetical protein